VLSGSQTFGTGFGTGRIGVLVCAPCVIVGVLASAGCYRAPEECLDCQQDIACETGTVVGTCVDANIVGECDGANVHDAADLDAPVIAVLPEGSFVSVGGYLIRENRRWLLVQQFPAGFVLSGFVECSGVDLNVCGSGGPRDLLGAALILACVALARRFIASFPRDRAREA
jgi:hypothetical protein